MVRIQDLLEAEKRLDDAMEALREYSQTPALWSAHEVVSEENRRVLVLHENHFAHRESLDLDVRTATKVLRDLQQSFAGGL